MTFYFDDFKPCRLNWDHNHQKMTFWKELIESYCYYKGSAQFSIGELKQVFKRKGATPRCLQSVISQMIAEGNLVEKENFLKVSGSLASCLITTMFVRPLFWAAESLKKTFISKTVDEQKAFVVKSVIHRQSQVLIEFLEYNYAYNDVIAVEQLAEQIAENRILSKDGLKIVLHDLHSSRSILIDENLEEKLLLIKVCPPGEKVQPFTELERIIYKLERMEKLLSTRLYEKETEIGVTTLQVKALLKEGKRQLAKSLLHKKHLLGADLKRIEGALKNIQSVLHQTSASASNQEILETYKFVSGALKANVAANGISLDQVHSVIDEIIEVFNQQEEISVDHVHSVIDEIKEVFNQQEEISDAVNSCCGSIDEDSQLEAELMELMNLNGENGEHVTIEPESIEVFGGKKQKE